MFGLDIYLARCLLPVIRRRSVMSIVANCKEELKRSPVTVGIGVIGIFVAGLALLVGWLQYAGTPIMRVAPRELQPGQLWISNLLLVLAFFLASSFALASIVRLLAPVHWFAALVVSVPAAVLSAFGTMLLLHLLPTKALVPATLVIAQDAVLWGTCLVFVAINGLPVLQEIARSAPNSKSEDNSPNGFGIIFVAVIVLLVWSTLVSEGLSKLVRIFLL